MSEVKILFALALGIFMGFGMSLITFVASALVYKKCKLTFGKIVAKALGDAGVAFIIGFLFMAIGSFMAMNFIGK